MPRWAEKRLSGWGRIPAITARAARPERMRDLAEALADVQDGSVLAYGGGRSYGDAALNSTGSTVITSRLDRLLEFEPESGLLVAEAGVRIGDVIDVFLRRGFMLPVAPGTGFATLGGAVANDVHGKNQHQAGSFGHQLQWLDLRLPDGELRRVQASSDDPLFRATLGGLGLTGIVERLCVRLKEVPSDAVTVTRRRIRDLDDFLAGFEANQDTADYIVGWIDAMATGAKLGRGILELAQPSNTPSTPIRRRTRRVPFDFPSLTLNPMTVRAFNAIYSRSAPSRAREAIVPYPKFLFPLDAVLEWNRIYGRRGFRQFQCLVPLAGGREALARMLERVAKRAGGSFLAVLKAMGRPGLGYLSFPGPGYTLALDFPERRGIVALINELEAMACEAGGRVYLAKDSTLQPELLGQMYPELDAYREVLAEVDPQRKMHSDLADRVRLRPE